MYRLTSSPQTLPNTANNGSSRLQKEKLSNFTSVVETILFKEICLLTIFFIDFLYADNLFYQYRNPPPPVEKYVSLGGMNE